MDISDLITGLTNLEQIVRLNQADAWLKASRSLIQVLVVNDNISGLTINLKRNEYRLVQER
jgi:hypothetical protein